MQATTMPKILAGLTRNSSTLSTKIARLRHTSAAAQYLSDVCKTYRLSMGSLFIQLVPSVQRGPGAQPLAGFQGQASLGGLYSPDFFPPLAPEGGVPKNL